MEETPQSRPWLKPVLAAGGGLVLALAVLLCLLCLPGDPPDTPSVSAPITTTAPVTTTTVPLADNPIDFADLQAKNPETVGWIRVPGTVINYPVMRSGEKTKEDFYLHHGTDGKYLFAGSIYMQKVNRPDFSDPVTLLYGHNMKNGSKFAALHKFKKKDFFSENKTLYIYTPGHIYTYEIYSVFVYDDRLIPADFDFSKLEELAAYQKLTLDPRSYIMQVRKGVTLRPENRIVTLSTCTNNEKERLLLHAVLREDTLTK